MIASSALLRLRRRQGHAGEGLARSSPDRPPARSTCRPASIMPSSDSTGTSTATTRAGGCSRAYQGLHPQPEMQADHRVRPGDDQDQHLQIAVIGRPDEIDPQQIGVVADIGVEEIVGDAGADDVADEQERDRKAEHDLAQLGHAAAASSAAATAPTAPARNGRGSCRRAAPAPGGSTRSGRCTRARPPSPRARSGRRRG